jgi:hypothetical protein
MQAHIDMLSVYAPGSEEPLMVDKALVQMIQRKVWIRDPNIYGRGEDNKFAEPTKISVNLVMYDHDGNTYETTLSVRELTMEDETVEPDE